MVSYRNIPMTSSMHLQAFFNFLQGEHTTDLWGPCSHTPDGRDVHIREGFDAGDEMGAAFRRVKTQASFMKNLLNISLVSEKAEIIVSFLPCKKATRLRSIVSSCELTPLPSHSPD
jgi:hypothetical protein